MHKVLLRILLVGLPVILMLGYVEYGLSKLDTHYRSKKVLFEKQEDSVVVLTLGSSNAYFGINPSKFSCTGFNLAYSAQSMYYDWAFIEKYVDKLPKLKLVVLPAIFYTAGSDLLKTSQNWRIFFYKQYYGLPLEKPEGKNFSFGQFIDARNYTKIALYGDTVYDHIQNGFTGHVDYVPESTGWYDSSSVGNGDLAKHIGPDAAAAHSAYFDAQTMERNIGYWQKIIDRLKAKNIQVLIVHLPVDESYYKNLDPQKFALFRNRFKELARKNNVLYRDYTTDPRFNLDDMTLLVDHMNPKGAAKFSEILNQDFIKPICQ